MSRARRVVVAVLETVRPKRALIVMALASLQRLNAQCWV